MSGAALLGQVPPHWRVKPLWLIGRIFKGTGGSKEDVVEEGVPCVRYGELYTTYRSFVERARRFVTQERATDYTPIEYGDVLFAASGETLAEIGKSAVNLLHGACCGGDVIILRPTEPFVPRFFGYAMDAAPVAAQKALGGRGTTVKHIYPDELREVVIAVPPVGEQQAIADFLDRETARIDHLLIAKQRLLGLLTEKRKAIVATAVTRGLDPKATLRDSGVPWLGEVPAHWDVTRLKYRLNGITQGWSPQCESLPAGPDDWGVLKAGCVNGEAFNAEENKRLPDSETPLPEIEVRPRDVVMSRANTTELVGSAAITPADVRPQLMLSDKLYRLNVKVDELLPELLVYYFRTQSGRFEFERTASGASNSMQNISQDVVRNVWLPMPPLAEQHAIVAHITRETTKLDAVRAATERTLTLLKERRAALIAAAVTGQLHIGATV